MSTDHEFTGTWNVTFWYPSNDHEGEDMSSFVSDAYQTKNKLVFQSRPLADSEAHLTVNLTVDGAIATGSWYENTDPNGKFEGMIYTGAMQLLVSDDGDKFEGQWVGVGREKLDDGSFELRTYTGKWLIERSQA